MTYRDISPFQTIANTNILPLDLQVILASLVPWVPVWFTTRPCAGGLKWRHQRVAIQAGKKQLKIFKKKMRSEIEKKRISILSLFFGRQS